MTRTTYPDGHVETTTDCFVDVTPAPVVTAQDVTASVTRVIAAGSVGTSAQRSLVNVKTVFWLNGVDSQHTWQPADLVTSAVTIRVRLDHVHWDFGDGTTVESDTLGRPYDPAHPCDAACAGYFGHVYDKTAGHMTVTAQAFWTAEFSIDGGPFQPLPRAVPGLPAVPVTVDVLQAHSELITGTGN